MPAFRTRNASKRDQLALVQFLGAEECKPALLLNLPKVSEHTDDGCHCAAPFPIYPALSRTRKVPCAGRRLAIPDISRNYQRICFRVFGLSRKRWKFVDSGRTKISRPLCSVDCGSRKGSSLRIKSIGWPFSWTRVSVSMRSVSNDFYTFARNSPRTGFVWTSVIF